VLGNISSSFLQDFIASSKKRKLSKQSYPYHIQHGRKSKERRGQIDQSDGEGK